MVFATWQPSFFKSDLDRIAFVESAFDKDSYPFFHWKYSSYAIALGINVNITLTTYLIIGLMFLVIGNYLAKTKQNYSAGIRIPWTLSSEENWNRTHRVSSRLFIFCGLAMIANGFLDSNILLFFIIAVLIVIPYAYSFFLFKKGI